MAAEGKYSQFFEGLAGSIDGTRGEIGGLRASAEFPQSLKVTLELLSYRLLEAHNLARALAKALSKEV